jgi:hypothetical protein
MDDLRSLHTLVRQPSSPPPPLEAIAAQAGARRRRRHRLTAVATVVGVLGVAVSAWSLGTKDQPEELSTVGHGQEPDQAPEELTPEPTTAVETPPPPAEPTSDPFGPVAPWVAEPPLAPADVPELVEAWNSDADARAQCPLLAPDDLGDAAGATPRATDRGQPGAWWVEFDLPGAPGEADIQLPDVNAGRATFSVAAGFWPDPTTGVPLEPLVDRWPSVHHWDDGSAVGWGVAGDGVEAPTQPNGWPT